MFANFLNGESNWAPEKTKETKKDWLFICGHMQRDERCGIVGPAILEELKKNHLCPENNMALISHIGGHKFAGNIIVYKQVQKTDQKSGNVDRKLVDCLWFSKVFPTNISMVCENLRKNVIIEELYRGGTELISD